MEKTELKVRRYGDPVLRKKSVTVLKVTDKERDILSGMSRLMYAESGIGLAAPQVGINRTMIVVDIGTGLYKLVNPRVTHKEGSYAIEEGCLSVPGVCIKVRRARKITVNAVDENGKEIQVEAQDLLACVLQHEIDHLRGKLIVDYATLIDKLRFKKNLKELRKRSQVEKLPESETKSCTLHL